MVTYGKTLGGGLPIGVVCGRARLMKRFREERPADICFARGTFNSHPYVMGAMQAFLERLDSRAGAARCTTASTTTLGRARRAVQPSAWRGRALPVQVANLSTIWTVLLHRAVALQLDAAVLPARARPGAELGRHRPADLQPELHAGRLRRGAASASSPPRSAMQADGWWWQRRRADRIGRSGAACCARCWRTAGVAMRQRPRSEPSALVGIGSISSPRSRCSGALQ